MCPGWRDSPCRGQVRACRDSSSPHNRHLEKVPFISMDDANLPHSTQGAQVVSQAGKLERQEAPVKDMIWGCSNLCHPRKPSHPVLSVSLGTLH